MSTEIKVLDQPGNGFKTVVEFCSIPKPHLVRYRRDLTPKRAEEIRKKWAVEFWR